MKELGKSGIRISEVGFGCMSLSSNHADNARLLHEAVDIGINFFDTADLYNKGENEKTVGNAFRGRRDAVILSTKVGNQWRSDGSGWDWNPSKAYILQAVEQSLRRLHTDYIDLYQLHGGTIEDPIDDTIAAFEELKQQGKIRAYGISSIRPNVIREYVKRSSIASVMMQYSLLDRRPEETCFNLQQEHEIGVLTRGSLASGLLIDKPAKAYLGYSADEVETMKGAIEEVVKESTVHSPRSTANAAQVALRFALYPSVVTSAVVGIRTNEQLHQAAGAMKMTELSEPVISRLRGTVPANKYEHHR